MTKEDIHSGKSLNKSTVKHFFFLFNFQLVMLNPELLASYLSARGDHNFLSSNGSDVHFILYVEQYLKLPSSFIKRGIYDPHRDVSQYPQAIDCTCGTHNVSILMWPTIDKRSKNGTHSKILSTKFHASSGLPVDESLQP